MLQRRPATRPGQRRGPVPAGSVAKQPALQSRVGVREQANRSPASRAAAATSAETQGPDPLISGSGPLHKTRKLQPCRYTRLTRRRRGPFRRSAGCVTGPGSSAPGIHLHPGLRRDRPPCLARAAAPGCGCEGRRHRGPRRRGAARAPWRRSVLPGLRGGTVGLGFSAALGRPQAVRRRRIATSPPRPSSAIVVGSGISKVSCGSSPCT